MYRIMPFNFSHVGKDDLLIVNECGDYYLIGNDDFDRFVRHNIDSSSSVFFDLKSKLFLAQDDIEISIQKIAARLRTRKSFLREFTSLHMMVITLRCNQRCEYCQVSCAEQDAYRYDMPPEVAQKIVDVIFESPTSNPKIEFQGGEPLLNWETIVRTVLYAEKEALRCNKTVSFVICTNLILITREHLDFCKDHNISLSTSLDGPQEIHDKCRKLRNGGSSYNAFIEKLDIARNILGQDGVDALMTTTVFSIEHIASVVAEYIARGMHGIFIRSLNPYGFAAEKSVSLGYGTEVFVNKYLEALSNIIAINKKIFFPEHFASLLFSRILTPFSTGFVDLQSPSGAGISGVIYDFDGSVFPSDEARMLARMGDRHFCLGNVLTDTYADIFAGSKLKGIAATACLETTPTCAWCVYQAYCGTDPVRNYLETGDELQNMEGSHFCTKHKLIFNGIFEIIRNASDQEKDIIWSWITRNKSMVSYNAQY